MRTVEGLKTLSFTVAPGERRWALAMQTPQHPDTAADLVRECAKKDVQNPDQI